MAKIAGTLKDGAGQIINNCTIELYAKKTTSKVLVQTQAFKVADNGNYEMNVSPCTYEANLIIEGFPKKKLGTIQVFADSVDGTLNDYLLNPTESEITPAILQQVMEARAETIKNAEQVQINTTAVAANAKIASDSATNAKASETASATSAKNAKISETNSAKSETNAKNSETASALSETNAKKSETAAKTAADTATTKADEITTAATSATTSANNAAKSEKNAKTSEDNAALSATNSKASETNSATSETNAKKSETNAKNSETASKTSQDAAKKSEANSAASEKNAKLSETNAKTSEDNAAQYAQNAQTAASSIDTSSYIKKSDMLGEFKLMPFRAAELPAGWYFRNGDNFLLTSAQGQALNSLSANYKADHGITIKTINGEEYINVPAAFAADGRGYFERAVNGTSRQVGSAQDDAIRNLTGNFSAYNYNQGGVSSNSGVFRRVVFNRNVVNTASQEANTSYEQISIDASLLVPTASENRPLNIGLTPAIYLGV